MTGEHLVDADDEVVVVNAKPPAGWQVIDGATGRRAIAEADARRSSAAGSSSGCGGANSNDRTCRGQPPTAVPSQCGLRRS